MVHIVAHISITPQLEYTPPSYQSKTVDYQDKGVHL